MSLADYQQSVPPTTGPVPFAPPLQGAAIPMEATPGGKSVAPKKRKQNLHRLREARIAQGVSPRNMARRLDIDLADLEQQEEPTSDLTLAQLYAWQEVLEVPITELLLESEESLSSPVMIRAQLVRLMKTVRAIQEQAKEVSIQRMAQMGVEQLLQIMPELERVTAWPSVGQYRDARGPGQAACRRFPDPVARHLEGD
jgi:transcriptional regulator with XRE-family HTH domain